MQIYKNKEMGGAKIGSILHTPFGICVCVSVLKQRVSLLFHPVAVDWMSLDASYRSHLQDWLFVASLGCLVVEGLTIKPRQRKKKENEGAAAAVQHKLNIY